MPAFAIEHYLTPDGRDLYQSWHDRLRDAKARVAVERRVNRLGNGNFGDHKYCRDGVWECASMWAQGIASTTDYTAATLFYCSAEEIKARSRQISSEPRPVGHRRKRSGDEPYERP
jgi:putative component of toxin-antitoxin plasmid stabilization module